MSRQQEQIAELTRQVSLLSRQLSRNTEAINLLSRKFFGVTDEKGRVRSATNAERIDKAVDAYFNLVGDGMKPFKAITEACRRIELDYGLGNYKNFATFRNMVNRVISRRLKVPRIKRICRASIPAWARA